MGDALVPDHQGCAALAQPFTQALERGMDCFDSMALTGKYLYAVLRRSGLREWSDYAKWAAEGAFEYVRRRDFPHRPSRLGCNYFYSDLSSSKRLFEYDWGEASPEERAAVRLLEVELEDEHPARLDMSLYDAGAGPAVFRGGGGRRIGLGAAQRPPRPGREGHHGVSV